MEQSKKYGSTSESPCCTPETRHCKSTIFRLKQKLALWNLDSPGLRDTLDLLVRVFDAFH